MASKSMRSSYLCLLSLLFFFETRSHVVLASFELTMAMSPDSLAPTFRVL